MYSEIILDHYKNPHNFGKIEDTDAHAIDYNPACGDEVEIFLKINNGKVSEVRFEGRGCAISQATASMLTNEIKGKAVNEIAKLDDKFVFELVGVNLSPVRRNCALLSLKVLKLAAVNYFKE